MASTVRTLVMSAAAASGVVGGGALGLAAAAPAHGTPATRPAQPAPAAAENTAALHAQVQQLLAEDRALHLAIVRAKTRLSSQVAASEASLRSVRSQLAASEAALAAIRRAAVTSAGTRQQQSSVTPASRPSAHATTGASGATSRTGDGGDSGHDD